MDLIPLSAARSPVPNFCYISSGIRVLGSMVSGVPIWVQKSNAERMEMFSSLQALISFIAIVIYKFLSDLKYFFFVFGCKSTALLCKDTAQVVSCYLFLYKLYIFSACAAIFSRTSIGSITFTSPPNESNVWYNSLFGITLIMILFSSS